MEGVKTREGLIVVYSVAVFHAVALVVRTVTMHLREGGALLSLSERFPMGNRS